MYKTSIPFCNFLIKKCFHILRSLDFQKAYVAFLKSGDADKAEKKREFDRVLEEIDRVIAK